MPTHIQSTNYRVLAISLSSRGFGYAVMEGNNRLINYGKKILNGNKNTRVLTHLKKLIASSQPDALLIYDVNAKGVRRHARIKTLNKRVLALAKSRKLRVVKLSAHKLRASLLGRDGNKHDVAVALAERFPSELATRMPPKRKAWKSEDARMDIFDAVALLFGWPCLDLVDRSGVNV